jgi:LPXTG-site transpeptidase (sortase) family protein
MKIYVKYFLLIAFCAILLVPLLKFNRPVEKPIQINLPARLVIPSINVDTEIEYVGVTEKGLMDVPKNVNNVGWFKFGPRPGEIGSAVVAGHVDNEFGKPAVFSDLSKLKRGDKLYIKDDKGINITFVVRESRVYNSGYAEDVFSSNDGIHLNLVTCDGVWDSSKKSYTKRLVVFTDNIK